MQLTKNNIYYDYIHSADGSIIYDKNNNLINFYEMNHEIIKEVLTLKYSFTSSFKTIIMIEIKDLHKSYQMGKNALHVLKGINFNVKEGEFVSIMGSSGSGKITGRKEWRIYTFDHRGRCEKPC